MARHLGQLRHGHLGSWTLRSFLSLMMFLVTSATKKVSGLATCGPNNLLLLLYPHPIPLASTLPIIVLPLDFHLPVLLGTVLRILQVEVKDR